MRLEYKMSVYDQLNALDTSLRKRITDKMDFYAAQTNPLSFAKHLTGHDVYRFRVGDYRIVCDVERDVITVLIVAKRDGVYKDLYR